MYQQEVTCANCGNTGTANLQEEFAAEAQGWECGVCGAKNEVPADPNAAQQQPPAQAAPADPNAVAVTDAEQGAGTTEVTG